MQPAIQRVSRFFYNRPVGLLLLRVAVGSIFLVHGWQKVADMSATISFFDSLGFSPLIAVFIAWLEILGGAALILGIASRVFAALLGLQMLIAAAIVMSYGEGIVSAEFELLLAAISFGIMLLGSGRFAFYKMECDQCNGLLCIKKNRVCVMAT